MSYPNTLIFVDFPASDTNVAGRFYHEVFRREDDARLDGNYHRMVPGQNFIGPDDKQSEIGNLHLGIFNATNARPHPDSAGVEPRHVSSYGRSPRIWVLVSDDDSVDRIMDTAIKLGATSLWRKHYWAEFNGYNYAFRDPWGNDIILWTKAGQDPQIPEDYTRE